MTYKLFYKPVIGIIKPIKDLKIKTLIIIPFIEKIEELYSVSDLIVSRSGKYYF